MDTFTRNTERRSRDRPEPQTQTRTLAEKSEVDELRAELKYIRQQMETLMPKRSTEREGVSPSKVVAIDIGKESSSNTRLSHSAAGGSSQQRERDAGNKRFSPPAVGSPHFQFFPQWYLDAPSASTQSSKHDKELEDLKGQLKVLAIKNQDLEGDLKRAS